MIRGDRLKRLLSPRRVAWFGGGGIAPAIAYMQANGFDGEAIAVNPKRTEIGGLNCAKSTADLPWAPDLAILVIPKEAVVETVAALSEIGCGGAVCITSGFSESAHGADRQAAMIEAAGDMPVIGPNCPGVANFLDGRAFMMDHFGNHSPKQGVAVISNGGAYLSDLGCVDRSQPIAYMIGLGNQAMVDVAAMLDVVLDDPRVTAVNIYFEDLPDAAPLSRAAAKAARKRIPVVAIKGGRSETGARAARSHTASLAGDAAIASALFERFGWIEVETPTEAIETLKMLSFTAIPEGMTTGFVTSSGSYAVLGGDIAEKLGLEMMPPSETAAHLIDAALPPYVGPANPLDISDAHGWDRADQLPIYQAFARDPYDLFVQVMCYPPEGGWDMGSWDSTTAALTEAAGGRPAAFVNTLAESLPTKVRDRMIVSGMAPLQGLEDGLRAVAHAARYGSVRDTIDPDSMLIDAVSTRTQGSGLQQIDEARAKARLKAAGLDVPRHWVVSNADELPEFSCNCALKAIVPGLLHKTEAGAVALDVSFEALPMAIREMEDRLVAQGMHPDGFLIEEMIADPVAELLVDLRHVPRVGIALTLAVGGVAVELMRDSATLILPTHRDDIETALRGLKLSPLLFGYRGRPRTSMDSVLDAVEALADHVRAHPEISELEINPLLLTETHAVVVDAALTLKG